jgi:hypothetical protein
VVGPKYVGFFIFGGGGSCDQFNPDQSYKPTRLLDLEVRKLECFLDEERASFGERIR